MILHGDCIEQMKTLDENSVDALVSDPPYGIGFMGKSWDDFTPRAFQEFSYQWGKEALRILKPGAWLLAFSGCRTYHRMVCGLEDAGFEISNMLVWMFGSGFPKALDISKAIDKHFGLDRKEIGIGNRHGGGTENYMGRTIGRKLMPNGQPYPSPDLDDNNIATEFKRSKGIITAPTCEDSKHWDGWYTQLKPACEPIVLAQNPREGTFAENVLMWGVGGLNIDGCRIQYGNETDSRVGTNVKWNGKREASKHTVSLPAVDNMQMYKNKGRYPPNVLLTHHPECKLIGYKEVGSGTQKHNSEINRQQPNRNVFKFGFDPNGCKSLGNYGVQVAPAYECHPDCPIRLLDEQSGELSKSGRNNLQGIDYKSNGMFKGGQFNLQHNDKGGASRFFYSGKAHKSERNAGLEDLDDIDFGSVFEAKGVMKTGSGNERKQKAKNDIATLKPINLMRYLVRLVCPKGGTVLDPFAGSGTTGIACVIEGMNYMLIEKRKRFAKIIIPKRLEYWSDPKNWLELNDHNALPKLKHLKQKKQNRDILSFANGEGGG